MTGMSQQRCPQASPQNLGLCDLTWQKKLRRCAKKNLEMGNLPKVIWVDPCNHKRSYKERRDMSQKEIRVRGGEDPTGHCWL